MVESFRKVALLMLHVYFAVEKLAPVQAAAKIDKVEKYVITREGRNDTDLFRIVYGNSKCPVNACGSSTAHLIDATQCICSCTPGYPTFLPALGMCGDTKTVKDALFDSCSSFFEWPFFLRSLDLESGGKEEHGNSEHYQSCHVVPQSAGYYNYQVKNNWVDIHSDIFTVEIEGSQVVFKWRPNKDKQLSARIIRVKISCDYSASRLTKTGCLVFKSSGQITYNLHSVTSSGEVAHAPVFVSSSASTTARRMISAVLLPSSLPSASSLQPSKKTPLISVNPSSSSPSPQPHQTKFISTTTLPASATSRTVHVEPSVLSTATQEPTVSIKPTKPSSTTTVPSSSAAVDDGLGDKNAQRNCDDKRVNILMISAAGGGAVVLGICVLMIIVFYKRRKSRTNKRKNTTKLEDNDIQMARSRGKHVMAMNKQVSEPTYQGLIIENGQKLEVVLHGSLEDNNTVYQSLNKKIPDTPVYQSLKKGQNATGEPNFNPQPGGTGHLNRRAKVLEEPVYVNGSRQIVAELGNMPEPLYNVLESDPEKGHGASESDNYGDTQDPLYVVLVGSDSERNCRALGNNNLGYTSDPLYNVLERPDGNTANVQPEPLYINVLKGPESKQDPQEPVYNVLQSSDAEDNSSETEGSYGLSNVPLCNVLKEPDLTGAKKSSIDFAPSNLPFSLASYDNQSYDQSLEPDVAYGIVRRPEPQRESVYEALREPDRCDLYEPLSKRRT